MSKKWFCLLIWLSIYLSLCASSAFSDKRVNLNGEWFICYSNSPTMPGESAKWTPVQVPRMVRQREPKYIWYKRFFEKPSVAKDYVVYLCFGGVKYVSKAFVNGREVGMRYGGWEPFEMDITEALSPGENLLAVRVEDVRGLIAEEVKYAEGRRLVEQARDSIMAPIGSKTRDVGIWQDVWLSVRHALFIDDIFVKTYVRKKQIEVDLTVKNASSSTIAGVLRCSVLDDGSELFTLEHDAVGVESGKSITVTLSRRWENPKLWSPESPRLYTLKAELLKGNRVVDMREVRFGFREFWTDGIYFVLNGKRIKLLATAGHPKANSTKEDAIRLYKDIRSANCVAMRLHANLWPEWWYEAADEVGMLLIEESALWCFAQEYALSQPEFWENVKKHLEGMVRRDKNHPSVVMYSVENEILHVGGTRVPGCEERLAEIGRFLKKIDPTRPIMYDGDEDPGGVADVINLHYPHEFPERNLYPNTCYWLEGKTRVSGYPRTEWEWSREKPLYIGEFLWSHARTPAPYTLFVGDEAYRDFWAGRAKAKAQAWRMQIEAYRALEVSGMCPWTLLETGRFPNVQYDAVKYAYEPNAAFVKEYDSRFFENEAVTRTVFLYNDTFRHAKLTLKWTLQDDGITVDSGSQDFEMSPAERIQTNATLHMPKYDYLEPVHPLNFILTVEEDGEVKFRDVKGYKLFPKRPEFIGEAMRVAVYDKDDRLASYLSQAGFNVARIDEPWEGRIPAKICVIGAHTLDSFKTPEIPTVGLDTDPGTALREFVSDGGVLLVLEQNAYPSNLLPANITDYDCTIAFKRADIGGIFTDIEAEDFKFWRGDNIVARKMFVKPNNGKNRTLVDSGGGGGLIHAGALDIPVGKGRYILSQLLIGEKLNSEPIAGKFLLNLLDYARMIIHPAVAYKAHLDSEQSTLGVVGSSLTKDLDRINLKYKVLSNPSEFKDYKVVLIDGRNFDKLSGRDDDFWEMMDFVQGGGKLILHALEPDAMARLNSILPRHLSLQKSKAVPILIERKDELILGLSNQELYWLAPHTGDWRSRTPLSPDIIDYAVAEPLPPLERCIVVEAEEMRVEDGSPRFQEDGVHMWSSGAISTKLYFPMDGDYILGIFASGTPVGGIYPEVTVYLDGERVAGIMLTHGEPDGYYSTLKTSKGEHTLSFAFTNDAYNPERGEDRNLFLDKIAIAERRGFDLKEILNPSALVKLKSGKGFFVIDQINWRGRIGSSDKAARYLSTLMTNLNVEFRDVTTGVIIDAASMAPQADIKLFKRVGRGVRFGTNGYVSREVKFASDGGYIFEVTAQGTKAAGEYPAIRLSIDGKTVDEQNLSGEGWQTLRYKAKVKRGIHELRIAFTNDFWNPPEDRNLEALQVRIYRESM